MKNLVAIFVITTCFTGISALFWFNEWQYSLPAPVPVKYQAVNTGTVINVNAEIGLDKSKPVFLHFFNPDCPCSKFNMPYFKKLSHQYADKISFAIVVIAKNGMYTETEIQKKYRLTIPVLFDSSIAAICGVYSTPQAVLLTENNELYYRGNYNKSRYCTDKKSNYAEAAIEALLSKTINPIFNSNALTAYGCTLPVCKK
jgi:thiol-disulfide isomerase/thioredoxin